MFRRKTIFIIVTVFILLLIVCTSIFFIVKYTQTDTPIKLTSEIFPEISIPLKLEERKELRYDYAKILNLTLLFYEAQRSGKLPKDQRVTWRHDSCIYCVGPNGQDLSGGYYDTGHNVTKSLNNNAHSMRNLAWTLLRHKKAYEAAGILNQVQEALTWGTDFLIQLMLNKKIRQVTGVYSEIWTRPEDVKKYTYQILNQDIPIYGTAASIAAASAAVKSFNETLAIYYLQVAKQLFTQLQRMGRAKRVDDTNRLQRNLHYIATAAWLSIADEEKSEYYRQLALQAGALFDASGDNFDFIDLYYQVLFFDLLGLTQPAHCHTLLQTPIYQVIAPNLDIMIICLHQGETLVRRGKIKTNPFTEIALREVNKLLGDTGRSFVTEFGVNSPKHVYHVGSSCPDDQCGEKEMLSPFPNPNYLPGALVNGSSSPETYEDIKDPIYNSVGLTSNTNLHVAIAILYHMHIENRLHDSAYHCKHYYTYYNFTSFH